MATTLQADRNNVKPMYNVETQLPHVKHIHNQSHTDM